MSVSQLSQQEGLRIGQAKLAAATEGYLAAKKAAKAMRLLCHLKYTNRRISS